MKKQKTRKYPRVDIKLFLGRDSKYSLRIRSSFKTAFTRLSRFSIENKLLTKKELEELLNVKVR